MNVIAAVPRVEPGDLTFVFIATAMVFIMTPGLAFFYGGMVRRKNVLNTMMSSFFAMGIAAVMWVLFGYSLSFGPDLGGIIGNLKWFGMNGVSVGTPNPDYASTIPHMSFAAFQMMFAIITPALITGALVERMKFHSQAIFIAVWSVIVYYPVAHLLWGVGGWLRELGAIDFAGGNVVHITSGVSALVAAIMLGKRKLHGASVYKPHNIPFVLIGAALLWFGWFGFNAGSSLAANGLAVHAFMTTNTSGAVAMLVWMLLDKVYSGKPTVLGAATGCIVGLASITQGSGYVPLWAAIIIGAVGSVICFYMISYVKAKFKYDDALDAFGCHGIGGIWGGISTGLFAQRAIIDPYMPAAIKTGWNGLVFGGDGHLLLAQFISICVTIGVSVVGTFLIIKVLSLFSPIRVSAREESEGLDITQHNESAYPSFTGMD